AAGLPLEHRSKLVLQCQAAGFAQQQHILAFAVLRAPDQHDVALARNDPRPASSPRKVREEPVTLCTTEMFPASMLESCDRNSVGRRSLISFSFSRRARFAAVRRSFRSLQSSAVSRSPPVATTRRSV